MSVLFKNCEIDLEKGTIKTKRTSEHVKNQNGYTICKLSDIYGNKYNYLHEVIIAEALQLPKHLWAVDEKGKRYVVDHIVPISNGGTNTANNLRLIPESDNPRNDLTRQNNSNAKIGKHFSPSTEYKKGNIPWNKGKTYHTGKHWNHSEESKKKMSEKRKGKHHSEETKKKMSETHPSKTVYQYTFDGKMIAVWGSAKDASKSLGISKSGIVMCCIGQLKQSKGYRWSYKPL